MARLHSILHEQGRQIDELRLENSDQRKRIEALETCLEEEMARRQGEQKEEELALKGYRLSSFRKNVIRIPRSIFVNLHFLPAHELVQEKGQRQL